MFSEGVVAVAGVVLAVVAGANVLRDRVDVVVDADHLDRQVSLRGTGRRDSSGGGRVPSAFSA